MKRIIYVAVDICCTLIILALAILTTFNVADILNNMPVLSNSVPIVVILSILITTIIFTILSSIIFKVMKYFEDKRK